MGVHVCISRGSDRARLGDGASEDVDRSGPEVRAGSSSEPGPEALRIHEVSGPPGPEAP